MIGGSIAALTQVKEGSGYTHASQCSDFNDAAQKKHQTGSANPQGAR